MIAKQDGLDLAAVLAEHAGQHMCSGGGHLWLAEYGPCLPYRLAALALDLQGKVARVEALANRWAASPGEKARWASAQVLAAALADPTPAARCPQQTPFVGFDLAAETNLTRWSV